MMGLSNTVDIFELLMNKHNIAKNGKAVLRQSLLKGPNFQVSGLEYGAQQTKRQIDNVT